MISFIWSPGSPLPAGTGGSENYTVGQVRELKRRGIPTQVVTVGLGVEDGRADFVGIPFLSLRTLAEVGDLDGTVDALLAVFAQPLPITPAKIVRQLEELILAPSADVRDVVHPGDRLTGTAP